MLSLLVITGVWHYTMKMEGPLHGFFRLFHIEELTAELSFG